MNILKVSSLLFGNVGTFGGAISCSFQSSLSINKTLISKSISSAKGSVMNSEICNIFIDKSNFTHNSGGENTFDIVQGSFKFSITNSLISDNQ